jgi:hypothetical protein
VPISVAEFRNDMLLIITVLALKFVYYLDGEKAFCGIISDDISILALKIRKGDQKSLTG